MRKKHVVNPSLAVDDDENPDKNITTLAASRADN
jgi:hypothetical protein